jgi:hypothetical protein
MGVASSLHGLRWWLPAAAVALGLVAFSAASFAATSSKLRRYPYLTDLVGSSVTLNWATDTSRTTATATWGRFGSESCTAHVVPATSTLINIDGVDDYQWQVTIDGLAANTRYCYRIFLGTTDLLGSDPAPTFYSQLTGATPFSFAVFGDWGEVNGSGANADQANVMQRISTSGARFAVSTGDVPYASASQTDFGDLVYRHSSVFAPSFWTVPGRSVPLFAALGNHGHNVNALTNFPQPRAVGSSGGREQMDLYCCRQGSASATYPSVWYAFDAGNARFYVLDAAWPNGNVGSGTLYSLDHGYHWTTSSAQYQWLQADLVAHAATPLKFAFFHFPLYADSTTEGSDPYLQIDGPSGQNSLEGLLSRNGVDLVFNGHMHAYERNYPQNGIVSYVTGGGGAGLEAINLCSSFDAYAIGWSDGLGQGSSCHAPRPTSRTQVYHFLLVRVDGTRVTVTPTDELGRTFDVQTYEFAAPAPDVEPPTAPAALTATRVSQTEVDLSWTASTDNVGVTGYEVRRGLVGGVLSAIDTVTGTTTSYADTTVAALTGYDYQVVARDAAGNVSPPSNTATVTGGVPTGIGVRSFGGRR